MTNGSCPPRLRVWRSRSFDQLVNSAKGWSAVDVGAHAQNVQVATRCCSSATVGARNGAAGRALRCTALHCIDVLCWCSRYRRAPRPSPSAKASRAIARDALSGAPAVGRWLTCEHRIAHSDEPTALRCSGGIGTTRHAVRCGVALALWTAKVLSVLRGTRSTWRPGSEVLCRSMPSCSWSFPIPTKSRTCCAPSTAHAHRRNSPDPCASPAAAIAGGLTARTTQPSPGLSPPGTDDRSRSQ